MSLLLEALKKAELAKQQGAAEHPSDGAAPAAPADPATGGLSPDPGPADLAARPFITRDRLPDITQPLEILSEDLPSAGARRGSAAPSPASAAQAFAVTAGPAAAERSSFGSAAMAAEEQDRLSARQLFEAKEADYNPRRPFFLVVGALGIVVLGILGYLAFQIFAPRPLYYAGPPGGTPASPIAAAPASPPGTQSATAPPAPVPTAPSPATAGTPAPASAATGKALLPPQPAASSGATRSVRPPIPRIVSPQPSPLRPGASAAAPAGLAPAAPMIKVTPSAPHLDPSLERAWQALQRGDLALAREEYLRVLRTNPLNRDALLGLATIDVRNQNFDSAEARYLRVLEVDPRDPYAHAGLIALRGHTDPLQSESRLKNLLAQQPDATFLNFTLGNQYAAQGRWPDAQSAYFKAYAGDPENPEYAYNLAVGLDHLRQTQLALEYYQRALALAGSRAAGFDSAQVAARIRELAR